MNTLTCNEISLGCVDDLLYCDSEGRHNLVCKVWEAFYMVQSCNLITHNWYLKYGKVCI